MENKEQNLLEVSNDAPTSVPKYFTCKKNIYGWLSLTKRLLDGVQGGSGAGMAGTILTDKLQAAAWFGLVSYLAWLIRFGIGIYLDFAEIKEESKK